MYLIKFHEYNYDVFVQLIVYINYLLSKDLYKFI